MTTIHCKLDVGKASSDSRNDGSVFLLVRERACCLRFCRRRTGSRLYFYYLRLGLRRNGAFGLHACRASVNTKGFTWAFCFSLSSVYGAGDSRALLSAPRGFSALTVDHKPTNDKEKKRIRDAYGDVVSASGSFRINGVLNVSRAFGDFVRAC